MELTKADRSYISLAIEEGYSYGFFPVYWELVSDNVTSVEEYAEDIACMVWDGVYEYHLPIKWHIIFGDAVK